MDTFKIIMLAFGAFALVVGPLQIFKAARRKDLKRVFDNLVSLAFLVIFVTVEVWPNAIHSAPRPVHWLKTALVCLFFANWCGLSRWLFRRRNATIAAREGQN